MAFDVTGPRDQLARRFLHVNLNVRDAQRSRGFYENVLGLRVVQQTDGSSFNGEELELEGLVTNNCLFMYDWRGPRSATSLEVLEWTDPAWTGEPYTDPTSPGIHSVVFDVPSLIRAGQAVIEAGGTVLAQAAGSFAAGEPRPTLVVRDPDGVTVELVERARDGVPTGTAIGLRLSCVDLAESVAFYTQLGFGLLENPVGSAFDPVSITPAPEGQQARIARMALVEDSPSFVLCLVELPAAGARGPRYVVANHLGLFRMALRVDDLDAAHAVLVGDGLSMRGPFEVQLSGTKIDQLRIGFLTDPNGVVVEFVERSAAFFKPPRLPVS